MLSTKVITLGRQQRVQKHLVTWVHVQNTFLLFQPMHTIIKSQEC